MFTFPALLPFRQTLLLVDSAAIGKLNPLFPVETPKLQRYIVLKFVIILAMTLGLNN
jgi:hypothetical protein